MEAQAQHDPQKSTFIESEIRSRASADNTNAERRTISAAQLMLKFMMQAKESWVK